MPLAESKPSQAQREISRQVVALLKDYVGRGPTSARTYMHGDLVLVVLGDTLTKGERVLARGDQAELVREMRRAFTGAMREPIEELVARETGRKVLSVLGDQCLQPDVAIAACVLEPLADPADDRPGPGAGDTQETQTQAARAARRDISRGMSALFKDFIGRGATESRTYVEEDVVAVLLGDTLTQAELTLARIERPRAVRDLRREFQGAMRERAVAVVEEACGCGVAAFLSDHSIEPDLSLEVFLLDRDAPTDPAAARS